MCYYGGGTYTRKVACIADSKLSMSAMLLYVYYSKQKKKSSVSTNNLKETPKKEPAPYYEEITDFNLTSRLS